MEPPGAAETTRALCPCSRRGQVSCCGNSRVRGDEGTPWRAGPVLRRAGHLAGAEQRCPDFLLEELGGGAGVWSESCGRAGACASGNPIPVPVPGRLASPPAATGLSPRLCCCLCGGRRWPVRCGAREAEARGRVPAAPRARGDG